VYEWRLRNEDRGHARVRWVGVPVPVSEPKCWVADELAQDAFVHMQVAAMPGHEPPTAMDLNIAGVIATGAVEAMDVGLLHPAARIVGIGRRKIAHRLIGALQTGNLTVTEVPCTLTWQNS